MSDPFVGEIRAFPYNFVPLDWLACEGQVVSINQYQALYAVIRQNYLPAGQPVSNTTFYLPNLNGAAGQVGKAMLGAVQGAGLSNYTLGKISGVNSVALSAAEQPLHTHSLTGINASATATHSTPKNQESKLSRCVTGLVLDNAYSDQAVNTSLHLNTLTVSGAPSVQAHDNMQPYQAVIFAIATNGIYPAQP